MQNALLRVVIKHRRGSIATTDDAWLVRGPTAQVVIIATGQFVVATNHCGIALSAAAVQEMRSCGTRWQQQVGIFFAHISAEGHLQFMTHLAVIRLEPADDVPKSMIMAGFYYVSQLMNDEIPSASFRNFLHGKSAECDNSRFQIYLGQAGVSGAADADAAYIYIEGRFVDAAYISSHECLIDIGTLRCGQW